MQNVSCKFEEDVRKYQVGASVAYPTLNFEHALESTTRNAIVFTNKSKLALTRMMLAETHLHYAHTLPTALHHPIWCRTVE